MLNEDQRSAQVLICVLNRPADLERVRTESWYRIPVAHAPRGLAADYLAFYQTAAFAEERWAIRWVAPVQAVTLARRIDLLPDEPKHRRAMEYYYRFALGELERLATIIPSRRLRRISFITTTLAQLHTARDVVELWHAPAQEVQCDVWGAGIGRRSLRR